MLATSPSPLPWSGNIPEGTAPRRIEQDKHAEMHHLKAFTAPRGSQLGSQPRTVLVLAGSREWLRWEQPRWEQPTQEPALQRLREGSVFWGLLKPVVKII